MGASASIRPPLTPPDTDEWSEGTVATTEVGPRLPASDRIVPRARRSRTKLTPYLFASPPLLWIAGFLLFPLGYAAYISLFDWNPVREHNSYIGLDNYRNVFSDSLFRIALANTVYYALVYVTSVTVVGLLAAVLIQAIRPPRSDALRAVIFLPAITSGVAVGLIWRWLYHPSFGIINYLLNQAGIGPVRWLGDADLAMGSVVAAVLWKHLGFVTVIFLAGLLGIPSVYYEAARVDGANPLQAFVQITLPLLRNVTLFVVATGFIGAFQIFTEIYVLTGGGPGTSTTTLVMEIYNRGFKYLRMGEAAAMSWVLFAIIFIVTIVQLRVFRSDVTYS